MLIARLGTDRVVAEPGIIGATCPACGQEVVAKCGELVTWHWAHKSWECDAWSDGETAWHSRWKMRFPSECREVVMDNHRADVRLPSGLVIEFQRSHLDIYQMREREEFYGKMLWVVHADDFRERLFIRRDMPHPHWPPFQFKWARARSTWSHAMRPVIFDAPVYVPIENRVNDEQTVTEWQAHPWRRELFCVDDWPDGDFEGNGSFWPIGALIRGTTPERSESAWVRHDYETEDKPSRRPLRNTRRFGPWISTLFDIDDDSRWRRT